MKKFKLAVAFLAVTFAVSSSFITKPSLLTVDGYYANKDRDPMTEQPDPAGNESEANIDSEVALAGSLTNWGGSHCFAPFSRVCSVRIVGNVVVQIISGSYL